MNMERPIYFSGDEVRLDDVVDLGGGNGPKGRVVVIIPTGEAVDGFNGSDWAYLNAGVMFEEKTMFGLLHVEKLDAEFILVARAQQAVQPDRREDAAPG
jgi:hypothetical protein